MKMDLTREMCLRGEEDTGSLVETHVFYSAWCFAICVKLEAEHMVIEHKLLFHFFF